MLDLKKYCCHGFIEGKTNQAQNEMRKKWFDSIKPDKYK